MCMIVYNIMFKICVLIMFIFCMHNTSILYQANLKWTSSLGGVLSKQQRHTFTSWLVKKYCVVGMNVRNE